jgi:thioredoxin 1
MQSGTRTVLRQSTFTMERFMAMKAVTDATFQDEIQDRQGLSLVDFWAPWCAPCRVLEPVVEQLANEYGDRLTVAKLNVDDNPRTAATLHVHSIPTLLLFRDGEVVETVVGAIPKARLEARIQPYL